VLDPQDREPAVVAQPQQEPREVLLLLTGQARGRLVEQHELRLRAQRPRDPDELLHPKRQRRDRRVPVALDLEEVDDLLDPLAGGLLGAPVAEPEAGGPRGAGEPARHPDQQVLDHGQLFEELAVLERAADPAARDVVGVAAQERAAVEADVAAGRAVDAADRVEQRGLARAVRADQRDELVVAHAERQPVHGRDLAEADADLVDFEHVVTPTSAACAGTGAPRGTTAGSRRPTSPGRTP
jgi:hypothetical protein